MFEGEKIRVGALGSGRGSNILAILDNIASSKLAAEMCVVLTDKADAPLRSSVAAQGITEIYVNPRDFADRRQYDLELIRLLREHRVDLVLLAGYMRVITKSFIDAFPLRIMNIHPSLLPAFRGLDVQKKALEYGVKYSGCTVHFVDQGVDTGPIIIQAVVEVKDKDTPQSLSQRILKEEHRIYSEAIDLFVQGRLRVEGRRVLII